MAESSSGRQKCIRSSPAYLFPRVADHETSWTIRYGAAAVAAAADAAATNNKPEKFEKLENVRAEIYV